ncbi:Cyclin-P1-1 [Hondaea fermentalgiana]|uniref:Cyclin-P1-1 n=1 Tax=Hondaea fermentalgiana TaxID=2315210 RepID=A0A2R5GNG5_9STRA|nr:Cyclin-P1-1 [Hondaea fermentalgiana]|eukprot:GBG29851.1 Cyclin-P1-1 [Hondaea fermentalgiana]
MRATSIEVGLATPPLAPKTNRHADSGHATNTKTTTTTKYSLGNKKNNLGWNNSEDDDDDEEEEEEAKETGRFTSARDPARRSRSRGCSSSTTCSTSSSSADSVRNGSDDVRRLHVCTEHTTAASCDGGKNSNTATSTSPSSAACTPAGAPCTSPIFVHGSKMSPPPKKISTTLSTSSKRQRRPEQEAQEIDLVARALWALASVRGAQRGEAIMARLDCSQVPGMELGKYLKRVLRSLNKNDVETVSRDNVLQMRFTVGFRLLGSALVLIDRLIARTSHRDAPLLVSQLNAHRLMLCCMMLVSKFSEDEPLNNAFWASTGGMPLAELNECELILFKLLDFETRVAEEDFVLLLQRLGIVI